MGGRSSAAFLLSLLGLSGGVGRCITAILLFFGPFIVYVGLHHTSFKGIGMLVAVVILPLLSVFPQLILIACKNVAVVLIVAHSCPPSQSSFFYSAVECIGLHAKLLHSGTGGHLPGPPPPTHRCHLLWVYINGFPALVLALFLCNGNALPLPL